MKKKTELAPSELRANHSLKGTIKGPGPAKIIFKKKIQQKGKTLRSTYKNEIGANYLRSDGRETKQTPTTARGKATQDGLKL